MKPSLNSSSSPSTVIDRNVVFAPGSGANGRSAIRVDSSHCTRARVQWLLSTRTEDLPFAPQAGVRTTHRSIAVDGQDLEFSDGFADLHTRVYEEALAGRGFRIEDARPSIELSHRIRHTDVTSADASLRHPLLARI